MAASVDDIRRWFDDGVRDDAKWMLVVCDTFDWEDYPVYITDAKEYDKIFVEHSTNMQKVMESYDLSKSKEEQCRPGVRVMNRPQSSP